MKKNTIRGARWWLVLACAVWGGLAAMPVSALAQAPSVAPTQFPDALTSIEFEALLPRTGVPADAATSARAMAEYDRYQALMSALTLGAKEKYLGEHTSLASPWSGRGAEEVQSSVRAYRGLLSQYEAAEVALVDSLAALGADPAKLARLRNTLEARRIAQTAGARGRSRGVGTGDLRATCLKAIETLSSEEQVRVDARFAAREEEFLAALRAVRAAALEEPVRTAAVPDAQTTSPPAEIIQRVQEAQRRTTADPDDQEAKAELEAAMQEFNTSWRATMVEQQRARREALAEVRRPLLEARERVQRMASAIVWDAFSDTQPPAAATAWIAAMKTFGSDRGLLSDRGTVQLVQSSARRNPLTAEQVAVVNAAFESWRAGVERDFFATPEMGDWMVGFSDGGATLNTLRDLQRTAEARAVTLYDTTAAALGREPLADTGAAAGGHHAEGHLVGGVVPDLPDGATIAATVIVAATNLADEVEGTAFAIGGGEPIVMTLNSAVIDIEGGGEWLVGGAGVGFDMSGIAPVDDAMWRQMLMSCGADEAAVAVAMQLHWDYCEATKPVMEEWRAAPDTTEWLDQTTRKLVRPTDADIRSRAATLRRALDQMSALDAKLFDDLGAVIDPTCARQQREWRTRRFLQRAIDGASMTTTTLNLDPSIAAAVDPETVVASALAAGAIDAEAARALRAFISTNHHAALESSLRTWVESFLTNGPQVAAIAGRMFPTTSADGEEMSIQIAAADGEMEEMERLNSAMTAAAAAARVQFDRALDALPTLLPEAQRHALVLAIDEARYPETFLDPTSAEPLFAKVLAQDGVVGSPAGTSVEALRAEYRRDYAALRERLAALRPKAIEPDFEEMHAAIEAAGHSAAEHAAIVQAFNERRDNAQSASRQVHQLRIDREELNRRAMRQLKPLLPVAFVPSGDNPDQ